MFISELQIENLKTFNEVKIDFNNFNVLIGSCASGKSNLVDIFEFLNDISYDFHRGIKKHGGIYLKNFNLKEKNDISRLKVRFENKTKNKYTMELNATNNESVQINFNQIDYDISFKFEPDSCKVLKEHVEFKCEIKKNDKITNNSIHIINNDGDIISAFDKNINYISIEEIIPKRICTIVEDNFKKENIPIINSALNLIPFNWINIFKNISVYDFDSKILKSLNSNYDDADKLTKYGANFPIVINNILKNESSHNRLIRFLSNYLPYIKDIHIEKILDENRILMILESYNDIKMPAPFISDGTCMIIALIIAIYFQEGQIIVIEEPEIHIHPSMLSKLMLMFKSVKDKQIIITTHNPELLKHADLDNIILILRDEDGFSKVNHLTNNEFVKPFIEDIGIDDVFVNDFLGVGL